MLCNGIVEEGDVVAIELVGFNQFDLFEPALVRCPFIFLIT